MLAISESKFKADKSTFILKIREKEMPM